MKFPNRLLYGFIHIIAVVLMLTACTSPIISDRTPPVPQLAHIDAFKDRGDRLGAARAYLDAAATQSSPVDQILRLNAAEVLIYPELTAQGEGMLSRILEDMDVTRLDRESRVRFLLYRAELAHYRGFSEWALQRLPVGLSHLEPSLQRQIGSTHIKLLTELGRYAEVVAVYEEQERWQPDANALTEHRDELWQLLINLDPASLESAAHQASSSSGAGWIELALLARKSYPRDTLKEQFIHQWRLRYPSHPADARYVEKVRAPHIMVEVAPATPDRRIALLLPQTGNLEPAGSAILAGINAAYYELPTDERPQITVYDTHQNDITTLHQRAVQDGAQLIIGPLERQSVQQLANQELSVQTLALNRAPQLTNTSPNLYQFALNPEEEAIHVAEKASSLGYRNAVVFAPQDALGERLLAAFAQRFRELGGALTAVQQYLPQETDHTTTVVIGLGIADSLERYRQMRDSSPMPRADIDVIFIAGNAAQARLLYPLLGSHHAQDIPVLATSQVYSGIADPDANTVLHQLGFVDIPWLIPDIGLRQDLRSMEGAAYNLPRLFALGFDAMRIVHQLPHLRQTQTPFHGLTGSLYLNPQGIVHRKLSWARFSNGHVVSIDAPVRYLPENEIDARVLPMPVGDETSPEEAINPLFRRD